MQLFNPLICRKMLPALTEPVEQACCHCAIECTGAVRGADAHFHSLNQLS